MAPKPLTDEAKSKKVMGAMSEVEALIHAVKEYDADEVRAAASLFKKKTGGNVSGLGDTGGRTPLHLRARPSPPPTPRASRHRRRRRPRKTLARRVPLIRPVPSPTPSPSSRRPSAATPASFASSSRIAASPWTSRTRTASRRSCPPRTTPRMPPCASS